MGWVPLAGGGGFLGLLGTAGWMARRRGRLKPPNVLDPPETDPALGGDDAAEPAADAS